MSCDFLLFKKKNIKLENIKKGKEIQIKYYNSECLMILQKISISDQIKGFGLKVNTQENTSNMFAPD